MICSACVDRKQHVRPYAIWHSSNIEFDEGERCVRWQTECWSAIAVICKAGAAVSHYYTAGERLERWSRSPNRLGAEGIAAPDWSIMTGITWCSGVWVTSLYW
jgi:hypothetical protein